MTLNPDQFGGPWHHGSGHWFRPGETVTPTDTLFTMEPHAYASRSQTQAGKWASFHAQGRAADIQGNESTPSLFRPVYEVEPTTSRADVQEHPLVDDARLRDPGGLKVKRLAAFGSWKGELV